MAAIVLLLLLSALVHIHARVHVTPHASLAVCLLLADTLFLVMGRCEQKERESKWAAASCQSLDHFLPPKNKPSGGAQAARSEFTSDTSLASIASATQPPAPAS